MCKCLGQRFRSYLGIPVEIPCLACHFRLVFFLFVSFFYYQLIVRNGRHIIHYGYTSETGWKANFRRQHIVDGQLLYALATAQKQGTAKQQEVRIFSHKLILYVGITKIHFCMDI